MASHHGPPMRVYYRRDKSEGRTENNVGNGGGMFVTSGEKTVIVNPQKPDVAVGDRNTI